MKLGVSTYCLRRLFMAGTITVPEAIRWFLGTFGIHVTQGVTVKNMLQSHLKNIMINNSSQSVLVADHSKFSKINPVYQCPVDRFDHLITDSAAPQADIEAIQGMKVQIHLV
jgi:DeoR/GlpR family transcriptional regulator of sugar metabolism